MQVAVHNGSFHTDDVFAIAIILEIYPDSKVIRTRDEEVLKSVDMRIDVGGKYRPASGDYDHHQSGGAGTRPNKIPYAACGLIWKQFGNQLTGSQYMTEDLDRKLISLIDANDNGYNIITSEMKPYTLDSVIDIFNPDWQEVGYTHDEGFFKCVELARFILRREIIKLQGLESARMLVREAIYESENPRLIILKQYCPWQDVVIDESKAYFVIFPSPTGDWRLRAVPVTKGGFEIRKKMPLSWAGKKTKELAQATGVPDALFCHNALFIAGAASLEGTIKLAEIALAN